jgi:Fic-DOC domain mobile mystery protein B
VTISFAFPEGATPLDRDEAVALIPSSISTQGELNEVEQANILNAQEWAFRKKHKNVLTDTFLRGLHKRMFGDVWKWAGKYRQSEKNIGVPAHQVPTSIAQLCADTAYWIEHESYPWNEAGARFHHKLVSIHAFPNGNGRHARLMTDILLRNHGEKGFTWGAATYSSEIEKESEVREAYLEALREADARRFEKLIEFVLS